MLPRLKALHVSTDRTIRLWKNPLWWIPVVSLFAVRPVATWSLQSSRSLRNPSQQPQFMPRRSTRTSVSTTVATARTEEEDETPSRKRKVVPKEESAKKSSQKRIAGTLKKPPIDASDSPKKAARSPRGAARAPKTEPDEVIGSGDPDNANSLKTKKAKAAPHQQITERDVLPRLWDSTKSMDSYTFRIASWNVAGLRALMRNDPTALEDLCREHNLDMLCLQETKLQESHLEDPKLNLRGCVEGYDDYWSCSVVKKGYSGTAVFLKQRGGGSKKKQASISSFFEAKSKPSKEMLGRKTVPVEGDQELVEPSGVAYKIGKPIDDEGRTITVEFPFATITNVYVPNSGQNLERLDYRTTEWDKDFLQFNQQKEKERGLPVIWLGDLNIAHKAYDIWNDGAKHLAKQAGVTEQERISFQAQLDAGYVDAFRHLHPEAKGHYSYWSQRAGNRQPNKGLRLDYFVCSPQLFSEQSSVVVRDSYMIPERMGSDHAPVVLELELKSKK
jgi:exodeoxyribonuclease III